MNPRDRSRRRCSGTGTTTSAAVEELLPACLREARNGAAIVRRPSYLNAQDLPERTVVHPNGAPSIDRDAPAPATRAACRLDAGFAQVGNGSPQMSQTGGDWKNRPTGCADRPAGRALERSIACGASRSQKNGRRGRRPPRGDGQHATGRSTPGAGPDAFPVASPSGSSTTMRTAWPRGVRGRRTPVVGVKMNDEREVVEEHPPARSAFDVRRPQLGPLERLLHGIRDPFSPGAGSVRQSTETGSERRRVSQIQDDEPSRPSCPEQQRSRRKRLWEVCAVRLSCNDLPE